MLWDEYASTVVTIALADAVVTVTPTDGRPAGRLPADLPGPVHVVTAWNPGSRRLSRAANDARHDRLVAELSTDEVAWVHARGCSPDGTWCEDGVALTGWTRQAACALARRHGQAAIFEVQDEQVVVVAAEGPRTSRRACRIDVTSRRAPHDLTP